MRPLHALLAAVGFILGDGRPVGGTRTAAPRKRRPHAGLTRIEKAHLRAADRKRVRDRLAWDETKRVLTLAEDQELRLLRLRRGKLARRMARGAKRSINARLRAGVERRRLQALGRATHRPTPRPAPTAAPLHVDRRITRAVRRQILREEGHPLTGRQWRRLRKALARQERAS